MVDPHGVWLRGWRDRHQRMGARHLRMPVSHCLGPPGAFHTFIRRLSAEEVGASPSSRKRASARVHVMKIMIKQLNMINQLNMITK